MKHKLESRLLGGISITSNTKMMTTLMVESKEELKNLLMKVKEENGKSWLKTQMFKKLRSWHHFMANIWGKWKHWQILFSLAPKSLQMITSAMISKDACSLEEKKT